DDSSSSRTKHNQSTMIEAKQLSEPADLYPVRRALLSVYDKTGVADLAAGLHGRGIEIISTGGTARALKDAGVPVSDVSDITSFPEILGGRVKTLHPGIHGGLLARRNDEEDLEELANHGIPPIDLVVVNLYPFEQATASADVTDSVAIENIDIGGPTMVRAAAKNFFFVAVVTSPADYPGVLEELEDSDGKLCMSTRRALAKKAFDHTARYDSAITSYFGRSDGEAEGDADRLPSQLSVSLPLVQQTRYGENPHQAAALYGDPSSYYEKLHGKELSFNNLLDLGAALNLIDEFYEADPTVAIMKHTNPCGVASADSLAVAYTNAFATDRQSPFGGIVVVNRPLDLETAEAIDKVFTEIIIAPDFDEGVLPFLQQKKNRRLVRSRSRAQTDRQYDMRSIVGGVLVQERDGPIASFGDQSASYTVVTKRAPSDRELHDLDFAWRVVKSVKSNAIVYVKDRATLGIGAGQMSRIDSSEIAISKGRKSGLDFEGCVVASDAFFPFADGLLAAAEAGATAAIQPGGSVRDEEVIEAADKHEVAMVFTGRRHFRH
ncbi:MAG: bifunctional phosphoribosylaminoimidazolecarboxamide formyltransferase/IMP cyclohydrolase, partial [Rhodothermales bacterium]|nr:bifunctional phosphoribosylaminoimidazolecarboxamide formyltransferase/IMP cyclohydrolase [Rhodothermales bacterium]